MTNKAAVLADKKVKEEYRIINEEISGHGRALLRQSGTEPVIRVMMECETYELCDQYIDRLVRVIEEGGYVHA